MLILQTVRLTTLNCTYNHCQVIKCKHLMTSLGQYRIFSRLDFLPVHETHHWAFVSRTARPLDSRYDNIVLPFTVPVWVAIAAIALIFAVSFSITHYAYQTTILESLGFHKVERSKINFLLYTVSKLTEPDPLPWFTNKWSAGKFLAMLWTVLGLFILGPCVTTLT